MDGGNAKRLSGTIAATPAALLVGRIQQSILSPRALLAWRIDTLIVRNIISTVQRTQSRTRGGFSDPRQEHARLAA